MEPKEGEPTLDQVLKEKIRKAPKKLDLDFFLIEDKKMAVEPSVVLEVEEEIEEPPVLPKEEARITKQEKKPPAPEEKVMPKTINFTFYCPTCKKWYGMKEFAQVNCPICHNPLRLSYYCLLCKKWFMVKAPGLHKCPTCNTKLTP